VAAVSPARSLFGPHTVAALNDEATAPASIFDLGDRESTGGESRIETGYERPRNRWAPIDPVENATVEHLPVRFIDGSIVSRLAGSLTVDGQHRPLIVATIAAAALELRGRMLTRVPGAITRTVLAVYQDGIDPADLERATRGLKAQGVTLLLRAMESGPRDFDTLRESTRNRAMDEMEACERDVLLQHPTSPTLVDGLLERRLVGVPDRALPVVGLVKQHAATYLPLDLQEMLYQLRPGQRSPAFVMEIDNVPLVNVYLRLSSLPGVSPSSGVVRVTTPLAFLEQAYPGDERGRYLSSLAGYLHRLRHRDEGYARAGISIEPIVRVEEHLKAIRPDIDTVVYRLHRLFRQSDLTGSVT
jgi:hypothetical protein